MKFFIFSLLIFTLITHQSALADSHGQQTQTYNSGIITVVINDLYQFGGKTYYDLQSNMSSREIWQDPNIPTNIHAVFQRSLDQGYVERSSVCLFSSDYGETWSNLGSATSTIRSGFPVISGTTDGRTVILCNSAVNGGSQRSEIFVDASPGGGSFQLLDPGAATGGIYPTQPTGAVNSNNKIFFLGLGIYRNVCTNINPPGTFSGYTLIANTGSPNFYSIAASGNRVGVVYITGSSSTYSVGSVIFMESTDAGVTWGAPVQVWNANYSTDSIGALRGADIVYQGSSPRVVFDLCKRTETAFYPKSSSRIMSWSPNVNGGVPVLIDSASGLSGSNPTNDVYTSVCRAVIGSTYDNQYIGAAWCKARQDTNTAGNNYFDIWFASSSNGGLTWISKIQITNNPPGPNGLRDCRYPSISPANRGFSNYQFTFHILFQSDSIPGSAVNGADFSLARMMYAKVMSWVEGVNNNHTGVPNNFILFQNYPNPFNPSTIIEYGLSKSANVKLTIYDINGREVKTLDNGFKSAGYHSAVFETSGLASGVYFYRLEVSDGNKAVFTESKKMLLEK